MSHITVIDKVTFTEEEMESGYHYLAMDLTEQTQETKKFKVTIYLNLWSDLFKFVVRAQNTTGNVLNAYTLLFYYFFRNLRRRIKLSNNYLSDN